MKDIEIWHNPRCSKSRQTLALLEEAGASPKVVLYLETPPTKARLKQVLKRLDLGPRELMRRKEVPYRELALADPERTDDELLDAMVAHPILIERPIVVRGDRAAIGRPPEDVLPLLD